jgi:hypothetical protein
VIGLKASMVNSFWIKKILDLISIVGIRGDRGLSGLPGLPGAAGLRGLVSKIICLSSEKYELYIFFSFSPASLVPLEHEDYQVLLVFQVK